MSSPRNKTITAINGVRVGHYTDSEGGTGLTVVLFDEPFVGAADISGMATSTRQIDCLSLLHPGSMVHAVCFTGGSAFGLGAATGVSKYLEENGVGLDMYVAKIPVVPTVAIYDLSFMSSSARPGVSSAYEACVAASSGPVEQGCIGAGTGATAGKLRGVLGATKTGLGSDLVEGMNGVKVGAIVVANPFGDILDERGMIIAGARDGNRFLDTRNAIRSGEVRKHAGSPGGNTTLCLVVTDAYLDKVGCKQVARMASTGLARHISPYNTPFDGDVVLCLSRGTIKVDILHLGVLASLAAENALMNAVQMAGSMGGLPCSKDFQ